MSREHEAVIDVRVRLRLDYAEIQRGETAVDAAEQLIVNQLGIPIEDILDLHELRL